jgi:hypothetical protein
MAQNLARMHGRQTAPGMDRRDVYLPSIDIFAFDAHGL